LLAELEDSTNAATDRYVPGAASQFAVISGELVRLPPMRHVVVDKRHASSSYNDPLRSNYDGLAPACLIS
jgi:hypothetical protein